MKNKNGVPRLAASQSFPEKEVQWLDQLFKVLRRGGDPSVLMRADEARRFQKRITGMKKTISKAKREREREDA